MGLKYALHPGLVTCRTDGQRHYISGPQLAACYGVPFDECVVVESTRPGSETPTTRALVQLYPDPSGRYELPGEAMMAKVFPAGGPLLGAA